MRSSARFVALGVIALTIGGCGDGEMAPGVPEKVDMNKNYTPPVDMPGMSPKIQKENEKKAKTEAAKAPAATPEAPSTPK
jgi:hypothetical protein